MILQRLIWLWLLVPIVGLRLLARRRRKRMAEEFAGSTMAPRIVPRFSSARETWRTLLFTAGVALVIVAIARPRFGEYYESVSARGVDLFVLLDVSRSMDAEDVVPSRLERAKSDIKDVLDKLKGDRVGLIAFAGAAVVKVPLTNDLAYFRTILDDLDTQSAPRGGSLIGDAIRKALASLDARRDRDQVLLLITDGEDHDSFPREAAKRAEKQGVKIFTVGLGDAQDGMRIPIRDEAGVRRFIQHDGQDVRSKLNSKLLHDLAMTTGGGHIPAGTSAYDLGEFYEQNFSDLQRGEYRTTKRKRYHEQFQWFLLCGIMLLLAEWFVAQAGSDTSHETDALKHDMTLTTKRPPPPISATTVALLAFALLRPLAPAEAVAWQVSSSPQSTGSTAQAPTQADHSTARRRTSDGISKYRKGRFEEAEEAFNAAKNALPDDPRIAFNLACAAAAKGDAETAVQLFQRGALSDDEELVARSQYNMGCVMAEKAKATFGEKPVEAPATIRQKGLNEIQDATGYYRQALRTDPAHKSARKNLELLRLWTKHMREAWKERDKQAARDKMSLLQFLEHLHASQWQLRKESQTIAASSPSPHRRHKERLLRRAQKDLADEIEHLKEKIRTALATQNGTKKTGPGHAAALQVLEQLADQVESDMSAAVDNLAERDFPATHQSQLQAIDKLNQVYVTVVPFQALLKRGIKHQESLVADSKKKSTQDASQAELPDSSDDSWQQGLIGIWSEALRQKAQVEKNHLSSQPPPANDESLDPRAQLPMFEKAIELTPQIETHSVTAVQHLLKAQYQAALPEQEQALKLLKEIAAQQPEQQNQQDQNQDQNQDKNDEQSKQQSPPSNQGNNDNENQNQGDDEKKKQPSDNKKKDEQSENKKKGDDKNREGEDKNKKDDTDGKNNANQQPQPRQLDPKNAKRIALSPRQVEALLRRVREREQEHREKLKRLQRMTIRRQSTKRDW